MSTSPTPAPDRHILCHECFAVLVPQFANRAVGHCSQCGSNKTAFVLDLPLRNPNPKTTQKDPIYV